MDSAIFPNSKLYDTGYCAIFVREISPTELLARLAGADLHPTPLSRMEAEAIKAFGEDVSEEEILGISVDELRDSGMFAGEGPLLRAGSHGEWSFAVESEGSYLARRENIKAVSRGTAALSISLVETGAAWISYAENEEILSSFDPLFPEFDSGSRPEVLEELTGYRRAIEDGDRAKAYENAVRKIQNELHCVGPQEADAPRLLAVRITGGY